MRQHRRSKRAAHHKRAAHRLLRKDAEDARRQDDFPRKNPVTTQVRSLGPPRFD